MLLLLTRLPSSVGNLTKNLLLRDKKHGMFMITTRTDANTRDTKALGKLLGLTGMLPPTTSSYCDVDVSCDAGSTNLRLCDEDTLFKTLGVKRGALSYLAVRRLFPPRLTSPKSHTICLFR